jgi:signal transduction histidine kinase
MFFAKLSKISKGIRFRLTLVYSTLFGLFICLFALIISRQYLRATQDDFDSALLNYAIDVSNLIQFKRPGYKPNIIRPPSEKKKQFPFILDNTYHVLRTIKGEIIYQSAERLPLEDIPYHPELALDADYTHRFQDIYDSRGELFRGINLKISNSRGKDLILQVATPATLLLHQQRRLFIVNFTTIPLLILISSIAGYLIAGKALVSVTSLTAAVNNIAAKNLSLRVPTIDTGDEISELANTFNSLLHRLEKAFLAQENFVANASHQLNTPLSIIKGELDVLENKERSPEEIRRFHKSLREELTRLIELVRDMLLISRVEAGQESFTFTPLRLDEILLKTTSRLSTQAREKRINQKFNIAENLLDSGEIIVSGEKQLLTCLFENLLENAIKYSPEDSVISIDIFSRDHALVVQLQDEGPGMEEQDLNKILSQRFQRGSTAILPGTGIGLAIAYQIAEYHQAKIVYAKARPTGSIFSITFEK